jgi:hypothetical protein
MRLGSVADQQVHFGRAVIAGVHGHDLLTDRHDKVRIGAGDDDPDFLFVLPL